jgi:hypothetical protein
MAFSFKVNRPALRGYKFVTPVLIYYKYYENRGMNDMHLLHVESMNGTNRLAEALKTRGLFVKTERDMIIFTAENTAEDVVKVRSLLKKLHIPVLWQGQTLQLLTNRFPIALMRKIIHTPGCSFSVSMEGYHFLWRSFAQRRFGIKVNALDLDANMALFVKTLNLVGITALSGCNGHNRYEPNVQLSGVFQGAWFQIVQAMFLENCHLHYQWNVHFENGSGSCIVASGAPWDMNLIYQDTVTMANLLEQHAPDIRALKRTFKRSGNMKQTAEAFVKEKQYDQLARWMNEQVSCI